MNARGAVLAGAGLLVLAGVTGGCTRTPLGQDEFIADNVLVRVPPPPGLLRFDRSEGRYAGARAFTTLARFGDEAAVGAPTSTSARSGTAAFALLPSNLGASAASHRARFEQVRDSWVARAAERGSPLEEEAQLRLAALARGHADSSAWEPTRETRSLDLGVVLADSSAVVHLYADMPDGPGERVAWCAEAFVSARGRTLQLSVTRSGGGPLATAAEIRDLMLSWVQAVRAANRGEQRHGRVRTG